MAQAVDFFDKSVIKTTGEDKITVDQITSTESDREKEILQKLIDIEIATDIEFDKKKENWEKYEKMMYGNQWESDIKNTTVYDMNNNPIYRVYYGNEQDRQQMPQRTENYIFPLLQAELAIINEMNPTVRVVTNNYDARERSRRLNLFMDSVFGTKVRHQYARAVLEGEIFGQGFLKINISKADKGKIPFSCVAERAKKVKFDPLADSWEDVRWVIFTVSKYATEVKRRYPKFKADKKPYEVISLKEFWVREDDRWNQYIVYSGQLLKINEKKDSYPVNVFEIFRLYLASEGSWGISEVSLVMEDQIVINKRASQMDFHTSMLVDPPIEVYGGGLVQGEETKLPLRPGEYYTSKLPNGRAIAPITYQPVNTTTFLTAIQGALNHAETALGVQRAALGQNEQGTYTGAHYQKVKDSIMTRIKMKEFWLKHALVSLGYKALMLAKEYTKGGAFFELWDEYNQTYQKLTYEDFQYAEVDVVTVETVDAAALDPLTRIEKMVQIKQYSPNFPDDYMYLCIEAIQPGFFDKKFLRAIEEKLSFEEKARKVQMDANLKQLVLQNQTLDLQLQQLAVQEQQMKQQQLMAQQQQAMAAQQPPQPPMQESAVPAQTAPIPSPAPAETSPESAMPTNQQNINWDELVESSAQTISQSTGLAPEQAKAQVVQILNQVNEQMPDASDMEKVTAYLKILQQG